MKPGNFDRLLHLTAVDLYRLARQIRFPLVWGHISTNPSIFGTILSPQQSMKKMASDFVIFSRVTNLTYSLPCNIYCQWGFNTGKEWDSFSDCLRLSDVHDVPIVTTFQDNANIVMSQCSRAPYVKRHAPVTNRTNNSQC